jgi:hypothetical protein
MLTRRERKLTIERSKADKKIDEVCKGKKQG